MTLPDRFRHATLKRVGQAHETGARLMRSPRTAPCFEAAALSCHASIVVYDPTKLFIKAAIWIVLHDGYRLRKMTRDFQPKSGHQKLGVAGEVNKALRRMPFD